VRASVGAHGRAEERQGGAESPLGRLSGYRPQPQRSCATPEELFTASPLPLCRVIE
jgi:hypothetical protein